MSALPDFDLSITMIDNVYSVAVTQSYRGGELPPRAFVLPFDPLLLPRRRRDMVEWVRQARVARLSANTMELQRAKDFGGALFQEIFSSEVLACFRASRAALPPDERLRVRLRLPPILALLPWELLYDARDDQFLALAPDLTLIRYPELAGALPPLDIEESLKITIVLASPARYPPINLDRELRWIEAALEVPRKRGQITLDVIRGADTLGQLRERLRQPIHILHVLCHGDFDPHTGEGLLIFEDPDGDTEKIGAELLRLHIQRQRGQTRLVLLNACLGALPSDSDPFSSVGAALVRGGVPAVVAMQFEIPEESAAELARIFYAELVAGAPVELALSEARLSLYGHSSKRLDWAIPVLFMRTANGVLFQQPKVRAPEPVSTLTILPTSNIAITMPPEPALPPQTFEFIGRVAEQEQYRQRLEQDGLVIISGLPGIGKTSLAAQLARRVAPAEQIFWHTHYTDMGIEAIIWALASFLTHRGQPALWELLHQSQYRAERLPVEVQLDHLVQQLRRRPGWSHQALLLVIDDLHLLVVDRVGEQLCERLIALAQAGDIRLLLVTRRVPDFVSSLIVQPLAGLTVADAHEILSKRGIDIDDGTIQSLVTMVGGNTQLILVAANLLPHAIDPKRVIARLAEAEDIERYLLGEVDAALNGTERLVMGVVAALLGLPVTRDAIEVLLEPEDHEVGARSQTRSLRQALTDLRSRDLLVVSDERSGRQYRQHAIIQSFYYASLGRRERLALHRRAGAYYEAVEPDLLAAARHYLLATEHDRAAQLVTTDVTAQINQGHAYPLFMLLEQFTERQVRPDTWLALCIAKGAVATMLRRSDIAQAAYQAALTLLARRGDTSETRELTVRAYRGMGELLEYEAPHEALMWLRRGLDTLGSTGGLEAAILHLRLGSALIAVSAYDEARIALDRCLRELPVEPSDWRARALQNLGVIHCSQGELAIGKGYFLGALQIQEQLGNAWNSITIHQNLSTLMSITGDWVGAHTEYRRALEQAKRIGSVGNVVLIEISLGTLLANQGDAAAALDMLTSGLVQAQLYHLHEYIVAALGSIAAVQFTLSNWPAMQQALEQARAHMHAMDAQDQLPEIDRLAAQLALAQGDGLDALAFAEQSAALALELGLDLEAGASLRVLGEALISVGRVEEGLDAFARSIEQLTSDLYGIAQTQAAWGRVLHQSDPIRSHTLLVEARSTFEHLGALRDLAILAAFDED